MRVNQSLTIKQMTAVSGIAVTVISVFIIIQLFHFVQQRRLDDVTQMENIAHSVRKSLSEAVLKGDIPQTKHILASLKPSGFLSHADVVLPNAFQALHSTLDTEKDVPRFVARLFELPVQITVPLYAVSSPGPKPLAYLVLRTDSWRVYQFILNTLATMVTAYLLLALILSVSISWYLNRLVIRPVRNIARELQQLTPEEIADHQLSLSPVHDDDELGLLVHSYNRNQQLRICQHNAGGQCATHSPVSHLPNQALFLAVLEQHFATCAAAEPCLVLVIRVGALVPESQEVNKHQRDALLLIVAERLRGELDSGTVLAQIGPADFALLAHCAAPCCVMQLAQALVTTLSSSVCLQGICLHPDVRIGIAQRDSSGNPAALLLQHAISAMRSARHQHDNPVRFFDPQLMKQARHGMAIRQDPEQPGGVPPDTDRYVQRTGSWH
ncbi:diguanylate cyclase domain-containing protein [Enterobacteriaceae bacterium LUAb1]